MKTRDFRNMSVPDGIDMFSTAFDGPFGWPQSNAASMELRRSDEKQAAPCIYCSDLFDDLDLDAPLLTANCYGGQGLGMWVDSYNWPGGGRHWQELNTDGKKYDYLFTLRLLGVRSYILGSEDPVEFQRISLLSRQRDASLQLGEVISGRWIDGNLGWDPIRFSPESGIITSFYHDEPLDTMMNDAKGGDANAAHHWERYHPLLDTYLANLLQFLCTIDFQSSFVFSTYDILLVQDFLSRLQTTTVPCGHNAGRSMLDLVRDGTIRIYPDFYSEQGKREFYRQLQATYHMYGIPTQWIRPFISTGANLCEYEEKRFETQPVSIICETIFHQTMGFGAPYLYTSGGWTQEKWDSLFFLSWILGCIEPDRVSGSGRQGCSLTRPTSLRGLLRLLCNMFPIQPTRTREDERIRFLECFSLYRDYPHPPENPQTCLPCCVNAVGESIPIDTVHYRALRANCATLPKCCKDVNLCRTTSPNA